jgi:hypothetical protein
LKVLCLLLLWACCSLSAYSTAAAPQLDVVYMPKDLATAAPTTEETLERHACVFTTTSSAEIQRIKSLLEAAPKTTIETPLPWYRGAIFLHEPSHGTIKYFFHVRRDGQIIPMRTLSEQIDATNNIPFSVAEDIFHKIARAQYTPALQNKKKPHCAEFIPAF